MVSEESPIDEFSMNIHTSVSATYYIYCKHCEDSDCVDLDDLETDDVDEYFEELGWSLDDDGKTCCPDHSKEFRDEGEA